MSAIATLIPPQAPPPAPPQPYTLSRFVGSVGLGIWLALTVGIFMTVVNGWDPAKFAKYGPSYLSGLGVTLALVSLSIMFGAILSLPLAFAILTVAMYLLTPVTNSLVHTAEHQADAFGLDAAREPHGFASVAMRLGTYRKLEPGALEEVIFFDHPSGRRRVARAMQWLADHPPAP